MTNPRPITEAEVETLISWIRAGVEKIRPLPNRRRQADYARMLHEPLYELRESLLRSSSPLENALSLAQAIDESAAELREFM